MSGVLCIFNPCELTSYIFFCSNYFVLFMLKLTVMTQNTSQHPLTQYDQKLIFSDIPSDSENAIMQLTMVKSKIFTVSIQKHD